MPNEQDIRRVEQGLVRGLDKLIGEMALRVFQVVVTASPVGDPLRWKNPRPPAGYTGGRFKGNWQISLKAPREGETGRIDKTGSATISEGNSEIARFNFGEKLIIQNNVPYAQRIQDGHSKVAPAGWIERGIQEGIQSLEGERLDFR